MPRDVTRRIVADDPNRLPKITKSRPLNTRGWQLGRLKSIAPVGYMLLRVSVETNIRGVQVERVWTVRATLDEDSGAIGPDRKFMASILAGHTLGDFADKRKPYCLLRLDGGENIKEVFPIARNTVVLVADDKWNPVEFVSSLREQDRAQADALAEASRPKEADAVELSPEQATEWSKFRMNNPDADFRAWVAEHLESA
ncbi:hypothetical protein [uncultured Roseibium sp.]|uniref:hypothetical protein n=1 Tax=uncultured Roseibium sp. TaxID=1936171 RepID=UPI00321689B7